MIVEIIGVNRLIVRGIVLCYVWEGRIVERLWGGVNYVWVDDVMWDCLNDIINENCFLIIVEMNCELRLCFLYKLVIYDCIVVRVFEGMLYWVKLVRFLLVDRNCFDVL